MTVGTRQLGGYIVERELGRGGMGVVSLARHAVLGTRAVVKQLVPELTTDAGAVQRFISEARAAAALRHPNIVQVFDCGQAPDGQWYIVLEYLDGTTLTERVRQGPMPIHTALEILVQSGNALHTAHAHGIIHRDVKPDNIFLLPTRTHVPLVKLLDFGIAKLHEPSNRLTRTGIGMGTPAYMPPEQLLSARDVDARADVYALGVVAFEMLTGGHLPWQATSPAGIYALQMNNEPPDPRTIVPEIPAAVAHVIRHAMVASQDERLGSVRDFILALAEVTPPTAAYPSGGVDVVRAHAAELLNVAPNDDTIGSRAAHLANLAAAPDARVGQATPRMVRVGSGAPPRAEPPSSTATWTPPPLEPRPTTLGSASGQSRPQLDAPPRRRLGLVLAGSVVAIAGSVALAIALGNSSGPTRSADANVVDAGNSVKAETVAVAVVSEPPGATIFVEGTDRGRAPLNVPVPVGQTVNVIARLDGYMEESRLVTGTSTPAAVRLELSPLVSSPPSDAAVDAGSVDASRPRTRPGARGRDAGAERPPLSFDPDAVGGGP